MKPKILIPVDFTKTSFSAFIYGNQLAKHIGADITLIHILQGSFSTADTYFIDTLENTEKLAKKKGWNILQKNILKKWDILCIRFRQNMN